MEILLYHIFIHFDTFLHLNNIYLSNIHKYFFKILLILLSITMIKTISHYNFSKNLFTIPGHKTGSTMTSSESMKKYCNAGITAWWLFATNRTNLPFCPIGNSSTGMSWHCDIGMALVKVASITLVYWPRHWPMSKANSLTPLKKIGENQWLKCIWDNSNYILFSKDTFIS